MRFLQEGKSCKHGVLATRGHSSTKPLCVPACSYHRRNKIARSATHRWLRPRVAGASPVTSMSTSESSSDRAATVRLGCLLDRGMMSLNVKKMVRLCAKSESPAVLYPKSQSTVGGYLWIKADLQNLPLDSPIFISSVYAQILTRKYNLNKYQISFSLRFEDFVFHNLLKIRTILA